MGEKKQLDWSRRTERDADSIYDYIALNNQAAARQVMGELRKAHTASLNFLYSGVMGKYWEHASSFLTATRTPSLTD